MTESPASGDADPRFSVAIVIFTNSASDMAAPFRALMIAREFAEAGDRVTIVFDGSGVDTLAAAMDPDNSLVRGVRKMRPYIRGACGECARAHRVEATLRAGGWTLLEDYKHHASMRALMLEGYQVLTF